MSDTEREGYQPDGTPIWSESTLRKLVVGAAHLGYYDDVILYKRLLREQYGVTI